MKVKEGAGQRREMEVETRVCANCKRDVVAANFSLHEAHCLRFLTICPKCEEPVVLKDMAEHLATAHEQVRCKRCHQAMQRFLLEHHEAEDCPERLAQCHFCELEVPFRQLQSHLKACGSRTTPCWDCGKYIMYKALEDHSRTCRENKVLTGPGPKTNLCQQCNSWFPDEKYLQHLNECSPLSQLLGALSTRSSTEPTSPPSASSPLTPATPPPTPSPVAEKDVRPKIKEKELSSLGRPSMKPSRPKKSSSRPAFTSTLPQALGDEEEAATAYDQLATCSQCNILLPRPTLQKHEKKCRRGASLQALRRSPRILRKGEESK
ncbi:XIAP-associated factor 1 isoform X1 [Podarcis muralis]